MPPRLFFATFPELVNEADMYFRLIIQRSKSKDIQDDEEDSVFADFDTYNYMAHYVAEKLHMRPGEILDTWGVPELIVAFGQYANEQAHQNYLQWLSMPSDHRGEPPPDRVIRFIGRKVLENG